MYVRDDIDPRVFGNKKEAGEISPASFPREVTGYDPTIAFTVALSVLNMVASALMVLPI
jgi:hypothetical protein